MNRYPKLSEEAYKDENVHRLETIAVATSAVADVWNYYRSSNLTDEQIEDVRVALEAVLQVCSGGK